MSVAEMTIQEFVDELLKTKNNCGRKWLEEHIKAVGERWKLYSSCPITSESLTSLLYGISARITVEISWIKNFQKTLDCGREFLQEIFAKGAYYGFEPDSASLDAVIIAKKL